VIGSALKALEGDKGDLGEPSVIKLIDAHGRLHSDTAAGSGQTVSDADRRRILNFGPGTVVTGRSSAA